MLFQHANTLFHCLKSSGCSNINSTRHKAFAVLFLETIQGAVEQEFWKNVLIPQMESSSMPFIETIKTLLHFHSQRHAFNQYLLEQEAFTKFKFEKEAFSSIETVDRGVVRQDELPLLQELVQKANEFPGPIMEIGTLFGFTTQKIALWKNADKKIITVDNYGWNPVGFSPDTHYDFTSSILWYLVACGHVSLVRMSKDDFFKNYEGEAPSMVFIDADHSYEATLADIKEAKRLGAHIICGHDYIDMHPGVIQAVKESGGPAKVCGSVWVL